MTIYLIKIVLNAIKKYCKNKDKCANCPFCIDYGIIADCMFKGPHIGEGVIPEDWELDKTNIS